MRVFSPAPSPFRSPSILPALNVHAVGGGGGASGWRSESAGDGIGARRAARAGAWPAEGRWRGV